MSCNYSKQIILPAFCGTHFWFCILLLLLLLLLLVVVVVVVVVWLLL